MEPVEYIDEFAQPRRFYLRPQLESLNGTSHHLPGGHAECTRLAVEGGPLLG